VLSDSSDNYEMREYLYRRPLSCSRSPVPTVGVHGLGYFQATEHSMTLIGKLSRLACDGILPYAEPKYSGSVGPQNGACYLCF
jgi:hypothetical protein